MRRDTAVVIKDGSLRQSYLTKMNSLKRDYQADILHSHHANFERRLQEYERAHRKTFGQILAARFPAVGAKHSPPVDFLEWVTQEKSQVIPLFIWGRKATDKEQEVFNKQVIPIISQGSENIGEFYIVGIYDGSPKKQDYHNGEIILTMKLSGHYIEFDLVDVVIYAQGKWWLCGLQSHIINEPFALTSDLKRIIRQKRYDWAEAQIDAGKMYLDSRDLRELAAALRADRQSSAR